MKKSGTIQNVVNKNPMDAIEGVLSNFEVADIATELKQRLDMQNMDLDAEILLEQIVILTVKMYLGKEERTHLVQ
jgi:hypothetical protein